MYQLIKINTGKCQEQRQQSLVSKGTGCKSLDSLGCGDSQMVKHLPCLHEDMISVPQNPGKNAKHGSVPL